MGSWRSYRLVPMDLANFVGCAQATCRPSECVVLECLTVDCLGQVLHVLEHTAADVRGIGPFVVFGPNSLDTSAASDEH